MKAFASFKELRHHLRGLEFSQRLNDTILTMFDRTFRGSIRPHHFTSSVEDGVLTFVWHNGYPEDEDGATLDFTPDGAYQAWVKFGGGGAFGEEGNVFDLGRSPLVAFRKRLLDMPSFQVQRFYSDPNPRRGNWWDIETTSYQHMWTGLDYNTMRRMVENTLIVDESSMVRGQGIRGKQASVFIGDDYEPQRSSP